MHDPSFTVAERESTAVLMRRVAVLYSLWMLFWVPVILWSYGPQNFLWLCNVAKFIVLLGLWTGNRLLLSAQAGTLLLVGVFWTPDFLLGLASGGALANFTAYMFNPELSLLARITSLYHIVLPVVLLWVLWRLGYDGRGPWLQSGIAAILLPASWLLADPDRNINWLTEPLGIEQVWLSEPMFVAVMMICYPLLLFWPGHGLVVLLLRLLGRRT